MDEGERLMGGKEKEGAQLQRETREGPDCDLYREQTLNRGGKNQLGPARNKKGKNP